VLSYTGTSQTSNGRRGARFVVRADSVSVKYSFIFFSLMTMEAVLTALLFDYLVFKCLFDLELVTFSHLQDFYSVLGVSKNASKPEIKSGMYSVYLLSFVN